MNWDKLKADLARDWHIVNGNSAAFPVLVEECQRVGETEMFRGLTKRELFAAMAMQGLADEEYPEGCAHEAVKYADALLAELAKEPQS